MNSASGTYVTKLDPLLVENSTLATRVLSLAAGIYNESTKPHATLAQWETEVVPLSEHLHAQSAVLEPPEEYDSIHTDLVKIWGERADAYRSIAVSIETADEDRWKSANGQVRKVKLEEEEWFQKMAKTLSAEGFTISQFP